MRLKVDFEDVVRNTADEEVKDDYIDRINEINEIYHWCVCEWYECKIAEDAENTKFEVTSND